VYNPDIIEAEKQKRKIVITNDNNIIPNHVQVKARRNKKYQQG